MMRKSVQLGLLAALEEEVASLCGPKYQPASDSSCCRAGSENGSAYINGEREEITRHRVRHEDGGEFVLNTYRAARNLRNLFGDVTSAMIEGMSSLVVSRHTKGAISKSAASRMWVKKSMEQLELLRNRPLDHSTTRPLDQHDQHDQHDLIAIQIDGVEAGEQMIVLAVGIDREGNKYALNFEIGSKSKAVVSALLERLKKRGVNEPEKRRLLVIRDGSEAIKSAVKTHWPDALQQECLIHQARNVLDKLRRRDRSEGVSFFELLREAQGKEAGEEAFEELLDFVSERNAAAALALNERRDELLRVHRLEVPSRLNATLLNTNIIENLIRNWRAATGNVKFWNEKETMVSRRVASGMLWAKAGPRKVRGYRDLAVLATSLATSSKRLLRWGGQKRKDYQAKK